MIACGCNEFGVENGDLTCNKEGKCNCKCDVSGDKCNECKPGHHGFPDCHETPRLRSAACHCLIVGSYNCDADGNCHCREGYNGTKCDQCQVGFSKSYFGEECLPCNCSILGSNGIACNDDFQCKCKDHIKGLVCDECNDNTYGDFPNCLSCQCNQNGSVSLNCSKNGTCLCNDGYNGTKCNQCAIGFKKMQSGECQTRK